MSPVAGDGLVVALIGTNDDEAVAAYDFSSPALKNGSGRATVRRTLPL